MIVLKRSVYFNFKIATLLQVLNTFPAYFFLQEHEMETQGNMVHFTWSVKIYKLYGFGTSTTHNYLGPNKFYGLSKDTGYFTTHH